MCPNQSEVLPLHATWWPWVLTQWGAVIGLCLGDIVLDLCLGDLLSSSKCCFLLCCAEWSHAGVKERGPDSWESWWHWSWSWLPLLSGNRRQLAIMAGGHEVGSHHQWLLGPRPPGHAAQGQYPRRSCCCSDRREGKGSLETTFTFMLYVFRKG